MFQIREALKVVLPEGAFADREAAAMAISDEAVRGLLEEELQAVADALGDRVLVDDAPYKEHEPGADKYHSLCGPLKVRRSSYRKTGVHNGPIVIALELAAGIIEGATPALAYNVAHGYAQHDMRLHEESLRAAFRVPPVRSTLERLAKRIGESAIQHAARIEPALRRSEPVPEGSVAVVMGLDRTSVPMIEDRPEGTPPKPEPKRRKPRIRQAPAPYDINWRMAYVGTLSFVDADGELLRAIRYASPACDDPLEVVEKMTADVRAALKRKPCLNVGIVQDGAAEMWNRTREGLETLRQQGLLTSWHEGIDRYHLLERLASALEIVEPDATARKRQLDEWRDGFDARDATIDNVERFLIRHYNALAGGQREALWEHSDTSGTTRTECATWRCGLPACRSAAA
jgi:hypothetical protein